MFSWPVRRPPRSTITSASANDKIVNVPDQTKVSGVILHMYVRRRRDEAGWIVARPIPACSAIPESMDSINQNQPESNRADFRGADAVKQAKELIDKMQTCFFCTAESTVGSSGARPMSVQEMDDARVSFGSSAPMTATKITSWGAIRTSCFIFKARRIQIFSRCTAGRASRETRKRSRNYGSRW